MGRRNVHNREVAATEKSEGGGLVLRQGDFCIVFSLVISSLGSFGRAKWEGSYLPNTLSDVQFSVVRMR